MTWAWQIQSIFGVTIDYFVNKAKFVPVEKKKIELFSSESNRPEKVENNRIYRAEAGTYLPK